MTLLTILDPATSPLFPPCIWRAATGWLCPGCGSARAIHALMHGHVQTALLANPLAVAALPVGGADLVQRFRSKEGSTTYRVRAAYLHALAVAIVLYGILRNLE